MFLPFFAEFSNLKGTFLKGRGIYPNPTLGSIMGHIQAKHLMKEQLIKKATSSKIND
jgi:hypothetical protein